VLLQVALPGVLNSAGKLFTFAALLKILVIAHGAVPWSSKSPCEDLRLLSMQSYNNECCCNAYEPCRCTACHAGVSGWEAIITLMPFGLGQPPLPNLPCRAWEHCCCAPSLFCQLEIVKCTSIIILYSDFCLSCSAGAAGALPIADQLHAAAGFNVCALCRGGAVHRGPSKADACSKVCKLVTCLPLICLALKPHAA
jgi:hypothetical protein